MTTPAAPMPRPAQVVVVVGTDTEIGKTWVTCELLRSTHDRAVAVRKPVQSFDPPSGNRPGAGQLRAHDLLTDADLLAAASGEDPHHVCPPHRWYEAAMAPPMAADVLCRPPFTAAELIAELSWPPRTDLGIVETVGGVRSPLADDADSATFATLVEPETTVLVADAGLGTINAVRLAAAALEPLDVVVYLNRYDHDDELHRRNRQWLTDRDGLELAVSVPELRNLIVL